MATASSTLAHQYTPVENDEPKLIFFNMFLIFSQRRCADSSQSPRDNAGFQHI